MPLSKDLLSVFLGLIFLNLRNDISQPCWQITGVFQFYPHSQATLDPQIASSIKQWRSWFSWLPAGTFLAGAPSSMFPWFKLRTRLANDQLVTSRSGRVSQFSNPSVAVLWCWLTHCITSRSCLSLQIRDFTATPSLCNHTSASVRLVTVP